VSVRICQPADGTNYVSFTWDSGTQILTRGSLIDVPPGSTLETAIGVSSLVLPTAQQLASSVNGAEGGAVSN
jgi:hypothetical protein